MSLLDLIILIKSKMLIKKGNIVKMAKNLVLLVLMLLPVSVFAQGKIAVLSVQEAILNTQLATEKMEELRNTPDYKEDKAEFDKLKAEGIALYERLQKDGAVMSAEEQQSVQRQIASKSADIDHVRKKLQESEKRIAQGLMQVLGRSAQDVITALIQSEGIGLLLDRQAALHADSSYNITAKVTDKLNQLNAK
jgi:outer membrane protein